MYLAADCMQNGSYVFMIIFTNIADMGASKALLESWNNIEQAYNCYMYHVC